MLKKLKNQIKDIFKVISKDGINIQVDIDEHSFVGDQISIIGNKVNVNGVTQDITLSTKGRRPLNISVHGNVETLYTSTGNVTAETIVNASTHSGDIKCYGVIKNIDTTTGDIECGAVGGNIDTISGDIECEYVKGNVSTNTGDIIINS